MGVDVKCSFWRSVWTGYVFWTLFTSLPALIWFYPLNQLEISGYETFVLILLSPTILRRRRIREWLQSDAGDLLLKIFCLLGIFSFRSRTTLERLCLLTIGTGAAVVKFVCDLTLPDIGKKKFAFWGYSVGFMAVLSSRIWYASIMPAFNDDTSNLLVFLVTFLNTLATISSFERFPSPSSESNQNPRQHNTNFALVSLGTGSLIHVMHAVFGEVSTPCRWVNGPFPFEVGPQPLPWGLAIYFSLLLGFWISSKTALIFHPAWSVSAAVSFFLMYNTLGWGGFIGAIVLAIYVTSVWPTYLDLLFRRLPVDRAGSALALAMFTYVLEALFSVWTVAYNFVPGGVYTRESTTWLIAAVTFLIGLGLYWHEPTSADDAEHLAFTRANNAAKIPPPRIWSRFVFVAILATSGTVYRSMAWNPGSSTTSASNDKNFTAMLWTYHFGYDNRGWPSLDRTKRLIENLQADVVGLLETDASRLYMGNNDLAQWLAESLQMYVDYGPNTRRHTWGSMLLSRYPILSSNHHLLPSPEGELAPAISAVVNISGTPVGIVVTHFGNDVDDEDRKLQGLTVAEITSKFYEMMIPTVFLGYVTSRPFSRDYYTLLEEGRMKDVDETDTDRFCEYIFYNRLNRLAYGRISHGGLSDTEIQAAKFSIPDLRAMKAKDFNDHFDKLTTDVSKAPNHQRLPITFGNFYSGHYKGAGHHYHMFTPKYFLSK